jgi:hypothetical protein
LIRFSSIIGVNI